MDNLFPTGDDTAARNMWKSPSAMGVETTQNSYYST